MTWGLCKVWKAVKGSGGGREEGPQKSESELSYLGDSTPLPGGLANQQRQLVLASDGKQEKKPKTPQNFDGWNKPQKELPWVTGKFKMKAILIAMYGRG